MKKFIALMLTLALAFALFACTQGRTVPPLDAAQPIVFATEGGLPVVNLDSPDAAQANRDIQLWSHAAGRTEFFFAQHGDVLSLILCTAGSDALSYSYFTWNFNIRTGELLSNTDLLTHAGWDFDELQQTLLAHLSHFYQTQRAEDGTLHTHAQRIYTKMQSELAHPGVPRLFWAQDGRLLWVGQLSFGGGLQISDDHDSFGAGDFFDILIDPSLPPDTFVFDQSILQHTGWGHLLP